MVRTSVVTVSPDGNHSHGVRLQGDTELKAVSAQLKKLTARVEALERLLQRIIQQKPVSERQLERALTSMKRSQNAR